jgi:hypothetical protein
MVRMTTSIILFPSIPQSVKHGAPRPFEQQSQKLYLPWTACLDLVLGCCLCSCAVAPEFCPCGGQRGGGRWAFMRLWGSWALVLAAYSKLWCFPLLLQWTNGWHRRSGEEGKGLGCIFHIFQDLGCNLGMYCSFILIFPSLSKKNEEWQEPDATNSAGKLQELGKRRHPIRHQRPLLKQLHVSVVDETIVRQVLKERSEGN